MSSPLLRALWAALVIGGGACAQGPAATSLREAAAALRRGNAASAVGLATQVIEHSPDNPNAYRIRASAYEHALGDYAGAIRDYEKLVELVADDPRVRNDLGSARFKNADIVGSIQAFDAAIALDASQEPHHWQRGISYYYAGRYEDGKKQFEVHRSVNPQDVENSVWHFLCAAPLIGTEAARKQLIPIERDSRVPMMQVYEMFRGSLAPAQVLEAANSGPPTARDGQLFYAHLYIGLFHEAHGRTGDARRHVAKATREHPVGHYMWHVARVHRITRGWD